MAARIAVAVFLAALAVAAARASATAEATHAWTPCQNVCGDIPVMYPLGTSKGCGSRAFEDYINCNKDTGKLTLYTPTGQYEIQRVDYTNRLIVIRDPKMSTCSDMQPSGGGSYGGGFGLPVGAPLAVLPGNRFVLLACSSIASNPQLGATLCDVGSEGTAICQALYSASCPSITNLGLPANSPTSSCCSYNGVAAQQGFSGSAPFQLNLQLLQCASYTSVYSFGPTADSTGSASSSVASLPNPNSWSFGIALKFFEDESGSSSSSCQACQRTHGVCSFNSVGFVCVCSAGINTTTHCFDNTADLGLDSSSSNMLRSMSLIVIGGLSGLAIMICEMLLQHSYFS